MWLMQFESSFVGGEEDKDYDYKCYEYGCILQLQCQIKVSLGKLLSFIGFK